MKYHQFGDIHPTRVTKNGPRSRPLPRSVRGTGRRLARPGPAAGEPDAGDHGSAAAEAPRGARADAAAPGDQRHGARAHLTACTVASPATLARRGAQIGLICRGGARSWYEGNAPSCRNECLFRAHIYARTRILTHALGPCRTIAVHPFYCSGRNQIADSAWTVYWPVADVCARRHACSGCQGR